MYFKYYFLLFTFLFLCPISSLKIGIFQCRILRSNNNSSKEKCFFSIDESLQEKNKYFSEKSLTFLLIIPKQSIDQTDER